MTSRHCLNLSRPVPERGRREFLKGSALVLGGALAGTSLTALGCGGSLRGRAVRFGVVTDLHYSTRETTGTRYYAESAVKLVEAVQTFDKSGCDFLVELGDLIDQGEDAAEELRFVSTMKAQFEQFAGPCHVVLGNHCVQGLSKPQFLGALGRDEATEVFEQGGFRFLILDACYRQDGVAYDAGNFEWTDTAIPEPQQEWLAGTLAESERPAIVFVHQRLDPSERDLHSVKNGAAVRRILEESGRVIAVFQGHHHRNEHQRINGIHYVTLAALVEGSGAANSAFGVVEVHDDGTIIVDGFHNQADWSLKARRRA